MPRPSGRNAYARSPSRLNGTAILPKSEEARSARDSAAREKLPRPVCSTRRPARV